MGQQNQGNELFIIPCCASKEGGGGQPGNFADPLRKSISPQVYKDLLSARSEVLSSLRVDSKYLTRPYLKNAYIQNGPDFGTSGSDGQYLSAIDRYTGKLYSGGSVLAKIVKKNLAKPKKPRILILSALYGPLHPLCLIQDYNLKMENRPASRVWKRFFPRFLADYVRRLEIRNIRLYLGGSTRYFEVAKIAVRTLKENRLIDRAVQFDVRDGNSYLTPTVHGQLLLSHLQDLKDIELENKVVAQEL